MRSTTQQQSNYDNMIYAISDGGGEKSLGDK